MTLAVRLANQPVVCCKLALPQAQRKLTIGTIDIEEGQCRNEILFNMEYDLVASASKSLEAFEVNARASSTTLAAHLEWLDATVHE